MTEQDSYGDWRSLELAIKEAAKQAARQAGPGVSAATVDSQIRQLASTGSSRASSPPASNPSGYSRAG